LLETAAIMQKSNKKGGKSTNDDDVSTFEFEDEGSFRQSID